MAISSKHQAFVDQYLECFNSTEAYQRVYSPKNRAVAASNGHRLLRNAEVAEAIKHRLQATAMTADEVLMRLSDQARADMGDLLVIGEDGTPGWDFAAMKQAKKLHHIKRLKIKTHKTVTIPKDEEELPLEIIETTIDLELYDAHAARALLGKHHGLFVDKVDVTHREVPGFTADDLAEAEAELNAWRQSKRDVNASNG